MIQILCLIIQKLSRLGALVDKSLPLWEWGVGSCCQRFDARRENMCFSLPADRSFLWVEDAPKFPSLNLSVLDSFLSPQEPSTTYWLVPLRTEVLMLFWQVYFGYSTPLTLFTFPRVRLYSSSDSDGPAFMKLVPGTQPLSTDLFYHWWLSFLNTAFCLGLDSPHTKPRLK